MDTKEEQLREFQLKWFDIVLQEYNSLRNESAEALKHQQSIINYGLTAIGVLIAFSANLWGKEKIVESIYVLFIPFMCNLIILIWNGEVRRMSRAGQYIQTLEDKIHKELTLRSGISEYALKWETYLRKPKTDQTPDMKPKSKFMRMLFWLGGIFSFIFQKESEKNNKIKSNYIAIIIMFGGLSILSIILGFGHDLSLFAKETKLVGKELWLTWISKHSFRLIIYSFVIIMDFLFFVYHYRYFQKVKQ